MGYGPSAAWSVAGDSNENFVLMEGIRPCSRPCLCRMESQFFYLCNRLMIPKRHQALMQKCQPMQIAYNIEVTARPNQVSDDIVLPSSRYTWSVWSVLTSVKTKYRLGHPRKKSSARNHSNSDLALELQGLHGPFDFGSVDC